MKIVNFQKHLKPISCHYDKFVETHSFDLEIQILDGTLIWQGWSIKEHIKSGTLRLQGPLINLNGKFRPAILFQRIDGSIIQVLVRQILKDEFGIDIPMPQKNAPEAPKIDELEKNNPEVKTWRVRLKKPILKRF